MEAQAAAVVAPDLLFCYGILKKGQCADLSDNGQEHIGPATLAGANLYGIGGGVGLRLDGKPEDLAHGDVFRIIDKDLWCRYLDQIENNGRVYTRKVVEVEVKGHGKMQSWVYEHMYYPAEFYGSRLKNLGGTYR